MTRLDVEWGRACDPDRLRRALAESPADIVALVHAETSTGVLNPVKELAAIAREHDALVLVDAVTSLGGHQLDVAAWGIDACYSCTQKCLGAPSGLAPIVFTPRALERRVPCRSFYLDLSSARGLSGFGASITTRCRRRSSTRSTKRWRSSRRKDSKRDGHGTSAITTRFSTDLKRWACRCCRREGERLWTLNAVRVPDGVDEAAVRKHLLDEFNIEIGAGLGPLAGKIWRVGLMGASSAPRLIVLLLGALESALARQGRQIHA